MGQIKSHKGVAGIENRQQNGGVGLGTGVGLNIGKLGAEKLLHTLAGKVLNNVYHFATAIIAFAGKTFCILVGQTAAHGLHYLVAHKVL